MATEQELAARVADIFAGLWDSSTEGQTVPEPEELRLGGNHGIQLDATVLYADMTDSTALVDRESPEFAAEIYKSYLHCAATIIRSEGGSITAYDGDRVMGVFVGNSKNTSAVRAALKINNALLQIIHPKLQGQYPTNTYVPGHTIGIDTSKLLAVRTGIRRDNDIVWIGSAANHAAKLCAATHDQTIRITGNVYDRLHQSVKSYLGRDMWLYEWGSENTRGLVYTSSWWFAQWYNGDTP
jgi:class 3 adenylate cyclase